MSSGWLPRRARSVRGVVCRTEDEWGRPSATRQACPSGMPGAVAIRTPRVDLTVLELEDRSSFAGPRRRALALAEAVLDDLVLDALLVERLLHPPAGVEVGVQERPGAAMQLDLGHARQPNGSGLSTEPLRSYPQCHGARISWPGTSRAPCSGSASSPAASFQRPARRHRRLLGARRQAEPRSVRFDWRGWFAIGVALGGTHLRARRRRPGLPRLRLDDRHLHGSGRIAIPFLLLGAGVLIGYGAKAAGGCTSGNGLSGNVARSPPRASRRPRRSSAPRSASASSSKAVI